MKFVALLLAIILTFGSAAFAQDNLSDKLSGLRTSIKAAINDAASLTEEDFNARSKIQDGLHSIDDSVGTLGEGVRSLDAAASQIAQVMQLDLANPDQSADDLQKSLDNIQKLLQTEGVLLQAENTLIQTEDGMIASIRKIAAAEPLIAEKENLVYDEYKKMADALAGIQHPDLSVVKRLVKLEALGKDFTDSLDQLSALLKGPFRDHVLKSTYVVTSAAGATASAAGKTASAAAATVKTAHDQLKKLGEQLTDALARSGAAGKSSITASGAVSPIDFEFKDEVTAGDCHMRPHARIQISAAPDGYDLRLSAQMYTTKSLFGDVWHITWQLLDGSGGLLLTTQRVDYPPKERMHPQFGDQNIDSTIHVAPFTPAEIAHTLSTATTLQMAHSC